MSTNENGNGGEERIGIFVSHRVSEDIVPALCTDGPSARTCAALFVLSAMSSILGIYDCICAGRIYSCLTDSAA